ncbi:MAG: plastocyanin/azurin family copper-binding protein [bacterium]
MNRYGTVALALCLALGATACGKDAGKAGSGASAEANEKHDGGAGHTIVVEAYSDSTGNYFKPSEITAEKGDIIQFTLKVGVHNVHFLADSNPGKSGLPPASDMLQLPGQTYDLPVTFAPGRYYFQCDPHALLGMKGHLTVKES